MTAARRLAGGAVATFTLLLLTASPVAAHLAIRLDIRAPQPGQHVGRSTDLVVFAQPMLAGVDHTTFNVLLDGEAIDPANGRHVGVLVDRPIPVSGVRTIHLTGLSSGPHVITVSYRPDVDEPVFHTSVSFRSGSGIHWSRFLPIALTIAAAGITAAVIVFRRAREMAREAEAPPGSASTE